MWAKFDIEKKIEDLKKRLMRIEKIDDQIESFRKKEISNVPTDLEIQDFIKWQIQIEVLKESLIDKGLGVRITPGVKGSLEVEIDGEKITDKKFTATGTESVSISSPNLGNVIVTAKLENARDAKSDIVNLEERIVDVFKKYSVNSVSDLKEKRKVQTEISGKLKELNAERKGVDERSKSELKHEMEKLTREIREIQDSKRTPKAIKLNPLDVNLGELIKKRENEEKECRTELDNARNERDSFDKDLTDVKEEIAQLRAGQNYIAEDLHTARDHERNVVRQFGSEENQEKILEKEESNLKARVEEFGRFNRQLDDLEKGPLNRIERLEQQIENQEKVFRQQRTAKDKLEERISSFSLDGTYSELAESESRLEILNDRLKNEKIKAQSYLLLKETLEKQYHSALTAVVGPIQEDVKHSLSYVSGLLHDDVELNEYLFPTRLGERGFQELSLDYDDSSSGLKEILTLCVRLAVAKHLSERDSQCLVLDDPFVHVSTDRSDKMIELINEAIKEYELQVIVFSHRPMELSGLKGKMIDIQNVKQ